MNSIETARLGDLIRGIRRAKGLTLEELSVRAGVGVRTLGDLERHRIARPHRRTIEALVTALDPATDEHDAIWASLRPPAQPSAAPENEGTAASLTVGRDDEMAAFVQWFDGRYNQGEVTGPVVLTGLPGIGKTTFGKEICRTHRDRFPDGRFHLDLGGFDDRPMTPHDALGHLLTRIGLPPEEIPASPKDRGLLYRYRMHTTAMIVGLDNAADEAQIRPLLVDSTRSMTIVASRRPLAGLDAGHRVGLGELDPAGSRQALESMIDRPERLAVEPAAADELIELCAGLPLALRLVGNRLNSRPRMTVTSLVDRMRSPGERLTWLSAGDVQLRSVLAGQYRHLTREQQSLLHRLSVIRTPEVSTEAAAVLLGLDVLSAEERLEDLVDAGVMTFGSGTGRYHLNELVRLYGRELFRVGGPAPVLLADLPVRPKGQRPVAVTSEQAA
ncbi:helix-turn-helix domain-containing protein [Micromonospora sp. NPDC048898]|uniref:helix-turn-helix domain-containing protein n=1 Tax=Micromonospora sp. NPDC048898 TaxID=3364260 RepID=UPI0037175993